MQYLIEKHFWCVVVTNGFSYKRAHIRVDVEATLQVFGTNCHGVVRVEISGTCWNRMLQRVNKWWIDIHCSVAILDYHVMHICFNFLWVVSGWTCDGMLVHCVNEVWMSERAWAWNNVCSCMSCFLFLFLLFVLHVSLIVLYFLDRRNNTSCSNVWKSSLIL